jgi:Spy/CpxP family protein refolding chaperone
MIKLGVSLMVGWLVAAVPSRARADEHPAQANEHNDPFEAMVGSRRLLRGAMLTEEQVAKIRELRRAQWAEEKEIQSKMKVVWEQLEDKFTSNGSINESELSALGAEGMRLQSQSELAKLRVGLQIRALLTPAQLARVAQAHQKMKSLEAQERAIEPTIAGETRP